MKKGSSKTQFFSGKIKVIWDSDDMGPKCNDIVLLIKTEKN